MVPLSLLFEDGNAMGHAMVEIRNRLTRRVVVGGRFRALCFIDILELVALFLEPLLLRWDECNRI